MEVEKQKVTKVVTRKKKYEVRFYIYPQNQIIKSLVVDDRTTFAKVKQDIFVESIKLELIPPGEQTYFSLMISFESYEWGRRISFPDDNDLVASTLQKQEWNSHGKVRLFVVDLRFFWGMDREPENFQEPKVFKPLETPLTSIIAPPNLFQELIHSQICNYSSFQGKLKRRYEVGKKKEEWRDVWCIATKDRFWVIPLTCYNTTEENHNLNFPFSYPINDDIVVKELRDKVSFSIAAVISHESVVNQKRTLLSVNIREDIYKAESSAIAKKWFTFLSYQNVNHHQIANNKIGSQRIIINNQIIGNDNDVFEAFEDIIAKEQYQQSSNELDIYTKIFSMKEMLFYKDVRRSFQFYLQDREMDNLWKLWEYLEDFEFSHPDSPITYHSIFIHLANYHNSVKGASKKDELQQQLGNFYDSGVIPPVSLSTKLQLKAQEVNNYALSIYHLLITQNEEIRKLLHNDLIEEVYFRLSSLANASGGTNTLQPTFQSIVPHTLFQSLTKRIWKLLEKLFYENFIHLPSFRDLMLSLQHNGVHLLDKQRRKEEIQQQIAEKEAALAAQEAGKSFFGLFKSPGKDNNSKSTNSTNLSTKVNTKEEKITKETLEITKMREFILIKFPPILITPQDYYADQGVSPPVSPTPSKSTTKPSTRGSNYYSLGSSMNMNKMALQLTFSKLTFFPRIWWDYYQVYSQNLTSLNPTKTKSSSDPIGTLSKTDAASLARTALISSINDSLDQRLMALNQPSPAPSMTVPSSSSQPQQSSHRGSILTPLSVSYTLPDWFPEKSMIFSPDDPRHFTSLDNNAGEGKEVVETNSAKRRTLFNYAWKPSISSKNAFHFPLQSKFFKLLSLQDIPLKLDYQERIKEILYLTNNPIENSSSSSSNNNNNNNTTTNESFSNGANSGFSKEVCDLNYLLNWKLKGIGIPLFTGIVKVDYFPSKSLDPTTSSKMFSSSSNAATPSFRSQHFSSSSKLGGGGGGGDTNGNNNNNSGGMGGDGRLYSSRSMYFSTDDFMYNHNTSLNHLFTSLQLYNQIIQDDTEELVQNFYSNPNFLQEDFATLLLQSYFRNYYQSKSNNNPAATTSSSTLMDGNEGSYSAPSTPIPSGRGAAGNEEGRSASPIPPPIYTMNNNNNNSTTNRGTNSTLSSSTSATTINTNATTTTSTTTTTSSQKFAQIQHPEKATSSFSINYFHRLKQFMVITLSPLDGTLHLYCFDLIPYSSETSNGFMNIQCNLHLLLNDKKTIKPTKSILHSFQIMDDYSNLYQFTFCDSNITPNGNNLSILSNNCNEISKMKMISCFFTMYIMIEYLFNYRWYQYQKQKEEQTKEQNQQTSSSEKKSSSSSFLLPLYAKPRMIFIIKEGFLQKRGRINTSFKWRYFVLTNDYKLRYYKDDTNYLNYSNYKGVIDIMLIDYDVLNPYNSIQSFDQKEIIINMQKQKSRRWALRSDIPEDIKSWTSALNATLFQYQDYLQQKNNPTTTTTSSNSNSNNNNSNSGGSGKYSSGQSLSPAPPPSISPYGDPNTRGGGGRNTGGSGSFGGGGPIQPVNFSDDEEDENEDEDD